MSQQEKFAWKAEQEKKKESAGTGPESSKAASVVAEKDEKETEKKDQFLRPSTPPNQTGSSKSDVGGLSPASQACTSGTVTPNSEGVRRSDRNTIHASPGIDWK